MPNWYNNMLVIIILALTITNAFSYSLQGFIVCVCVWGGGGGGGGGAPLSLCCHPKVYDVARQPLSSPRYDSFPP